MGLLDKLKGKALKFGLSKFKSLITSKLGSLATLGSSASIGSALSAKASKAKEILNKKPSLTTSVDGDAETKPESEKPRGKPDIYEAVQPDIIYDKDKFLTNPYEFVLTESIDSLYRSGYISLVDREGITEHTGFLNSYDVDFFEIIWANKLEENQPRRIRVGLYDMSKQQEYANFENRKRYVNFNIFEEPYYTLLNKKRLGDPYTYTTATEIIFDVMNKYVEADKIHVVRGDDDPKIPSFINPNWNPAKTIRYMQNYGDKGPIKVFNITKNSETITVIAPLQKLIANQVFSDKQKMFPSTTQSVTDGIKLPDDYVIRGVTANDRKSDLAGRSMVSVDYFYGNSDEVVLPDFPKKDESNYTFKGDFEKTKRSYASIISGDYRYGTEVVARTGNYLMHKKDVFREHTHNFHMDVESKPLIQTKLLNKFYNSFYDELMLEVNLPGYSEIYCGQTWDIKIPSINRDTENEMTWDESLSGDWLLVKMEHKVYVQKGEDYRYEIKCYFVKTGLEYTERDLADKVTKDGADASTPTTPATPSTPITV